MTACFDRTKILALHDSPAFGDAAGDLVAARLGMAGAMAHGALVSRRLALRRPVVEVVPTLSPIPREEAGPLDTFVLTRGNPEAEAESVELGVPAMLGR